MQRRMPAHKYREVLRVSLPLVISMATTMVMQFTDRIFLANYSLESIAAALPAGGTVFLFISFFMGTAGYLNVFIAQYTGAGLHPRVGAALWQGIYFSLLSGLMMAVLYFVAEPLFRFGGHSVDLQQLEVIYFRVLCLGAGTLILGTSLSCFYSGRGQTRPVMIFNAIGMILNIPLDYALINGFWIIPELGILGAGIATVASWSMVALIFLLMIFSRENDRAFKVRRNRRFDAELFGRLMRFGIPGALQFSMDIFAFTFFIFMVGRIGKNELAVTNIVFTIENLSFMPLMGFALGTSTLVGQALGRNRPNEAVLATRATIHIVSAYTFLLVLAFVFAPRPLLDLFRPGSLSAESYAYIQSLGIVLLRFVAGYLFFDSLYMICTGVLKGAGDTRFIMWSIGLLSVFVMILPIYIGIQFLGAGLFFAWIWLTLYVFFLFAISLARYLQGKWKHMRVIERWAIDSKS